MDSSQSASPNDLRRVSTTESAVGVDPAELSAPSPDPAPQPAPVNPTTLVPSEKTFELMRQLEALAHEFAVVGRSSNQGIKVQEGSNFSAGLQLVEQSIYVSPHDQLVSGSPSFSRRISATMANVITATRDWSTSYRSSFGRRIILTLANFFVAIRNWLASYGPSFGRRTSATLASFFIAALVGVAAAFIWQVQRVSTATSPSDVAIAEKQSGFTPAGQLLLQDAPQIAPTTQTASASTASATSLELVQQLDSMAGDLVVLRRRVEELAAKQEHLIDAQEQLAARQEQMAQSIAKPQAVKQNINQKMSSPSRRNASSDPAAQTSSLPRPRPLSSVPPDRR